jgi:hypothetical protein
MKFLVAILLTGLLAFIAGLFMPWWGITVASFVVALVVQQRSVNALFSGFLGVFLLWAGLAWWIDMKNNSVLSVKIASILPFGGNSLILIFVTGFIAGLVGGLAALSGSFLFSRRPAATAHNKL